MKRFIIYEIRNNINDKLYIGQYSGNNFESYYGSGNLIKAAINKYGLDNFTKTILEECNSKSDLNDREVFWIKEKNSILYGYNLTEGGTGGDTSQFIDYNENWVENQRISTKKYWDNLSEDERMRRRDSVSGYRNGMYGKEGYWKGKKIPKEMIEKQLENRRTYVGENNPNWKGGASISYCQTCGKRIGGNCIHCKDHIVYDRAKEKNAFFGKTHTNEVKKLISEKNKGKKPPNIKPVYINGIEYESLAEATRQTRIPSPTILWRINSKNKKFNDYKYL